LKVARVPETICSPGSRQPRGNRSSSWQKVRSVNKSTNKPKLSIKEKQEKKKEKKESKK